MLANNYVINDKLIIEVNADWYPLNFFLQYFISQRQDIYSQSFSENENFLEYWHLNSLSNNSFFKDLWDNNRGKMKRWYADCFFKGRL